MGDETINILGVDHGQETFIVLEAISSDLDINFVKTSSGAETLKLLKKKDFDLVLLRANLPEMNGFETAKCIRQQKKTKQLPIIFLDVQPTDLEHVYSGADLDCVDYLPKPLMAEALKSKISLFQRLVQQKRVLEKKAKRLEKANAQILSQQLSLAESEVRFRTAFDQSYQFMAILDVEGRVLELNRLAKKLCGDNVGVLKGQFLWNICWVGQAEENQRLKECIARAAGGECITDEARFKGVDGQERMLSRSVAPVRDDDGKIVNITVQGHDITARVSAEKEKQNVGILLQQARKMEALGALAGGVAHDFNNILSVILGNTELAKMSCKSNSPPDKFLESIHASGIQAKELVKQILSFSRQEEMKKISLRPAEVVTESLKLLRSTIPTTIEIVADIDHTCGRIFADPTQYHQILMNLCTNAYHAMELKGGTMTIRLYQETLKETDLLREFNCKPGDYAHLAVEDSGEGIDQSIIDRIFDPYFTTKESGKGTGMGLATVYGIIQGHNGAIRVDSQPGDGTAFHVYLPISGRQVEKQEESHGELVYGSEHILLVDDDDGLLLMVKTLLERIGYTVTTKVSATEAFVSFCESPEDYDLIITDQTMPGMTGMELAEKVFLIRPEIPLILSTGYSPTVSRDKVLAMGIKELAFKPLAFDKLSRLIRQVIDQAEFDV